MEFISIALGILTIGAAVIVIGVLGAAVYKMYKKFNKSRKVEVSHEMQ